MIKKYWVYNVRLRSKPDFLTDSKNEKQLILLSDLKKEIEERIKFLRSFKGLDKHSKKFEEITGIKEGVSEYNQGYIKSILNEADWLEKFIMRLGIDD